ncbi:MAG: glycoside hydrolase family 16 protein [Bacteroidales bacterium]|nr:glycoside hydrolase family 16 protein [Bacteroidales bacterium]
MKKFVYLCGIMLLCLNMMAQIDPYDRNWKTVVLDDFNESNRHFDTTFQETEGKWISFIPSSWPSGVTIDSFHLSIYQWNHCLFDASKGYLRLNSEHIRDTAILCDEQPNFYRIPPKTYNITYQCNPNHNHLYYYSGCIESPPSDSSSKSDNLPPPLFRYGYFEIKCQVPIHRGAKSSFWLWDGMRDRYYEEIDIYEFSWDFENPSSYWNHNPHPHGTGNPNCFTSGLYINKESNNIHPIESVSQARKFLMIGDSLSHWHTFACEWLPEHIIWYCDENIVDSYYNPDSIPRHPLTLKVGYSIDRYALESYSLNGRPEWKEGDNLIIDYINVYQLNWDCDTEEIIAQQSDLKYFDYGVKKSITVSSSIEPVQIESNEKVTFRATDFFEITHSFQVNSGGELTVIMQRCPDPLP